MSGRRAAVGLSVAFVLAGCTGNGNGADVAVVSVTPLGSPTTVSTLEPSGSTLEPNEDAIEPAESTVASGSVDQQTTSSSTSEPSTTASTSAPATSSAAAPQATPSSTTSSTVAIVDQPLVGSYVVEIVATYPHDPTAFTQGLEVHNGELLESTGRRGESDRRRVNPLTGEVIALVALPDDLFGEGLTVVDGSIYQLTWTSGRVLIADVDNLATTSEAVIGQEGWGICFDGTHIVTSDGTSELVFRDAETFAIVRTITARLNGDPIRFMNELECDAGQILANIWGLDQIVAIDPSTGDVQAVVDASALRPDDLPISDLNFALNGIAALPGTDNYYVTGKWWPVLYEIRFVPTR